MAQHAARPRLTIRVRLDREIGTVDRNVFGHFIEHFNRCVYGGVFDPGSPLADERGFRTDVLEAARRIRVPNLRWPGGNFASGYHWEDGVGPPAARPARYDVNWRQLEPNTFGTDEYLAYTRALGAAPFICVNTGSGTIEEACRWVEYCNLDAERYPSHHARLRVRNGHPEPYGVKLWGIGNEAYGAWQVGHSSAEEYALKCRQVAHFMRSVDFSIKLVAVGADQPAWDETVLRLAGDNVDYISIHQYHGSPDYFATVGAPAHVERRLSLLAELSERALRSQRRERPVQIALDEWNVCYKAWGLAEIQPVTGLDEYIQFFEQPLALKDALFAAGVFHAMFRQCRFVTLANLAQMVNVLGLLETRPDALLRSSIYHVFDLYVNHSGPVALETSVTAREGVVPAFTAEDWREPGPDSPGLREPFLRFTVRDVPFLDAQATLAADRRMLFLAVINYHPTDALAAALDLGGVRPAGQARATVLDGDDTHTPNTFARPAVTRLRPIDVPAPLQEYTFPPHSATVLEVPLAPRSV
jgi:alpha-N-arabinofuranosidase